MAKDHGPSVKNDKENEGLKKKGMQAARSSDRELRRLVKPWRQGIRPRQETFGHPTGGSKAQKAAAGRKGGKKSHS